MVRVLLPIFAVIGVATAVVQLTTTGCSDASGLQTCLNAVTASTSKCLTQADADASQLETVSCGCTNYISSYNCYASHCWERRTQPIRPRMYRAHRRSTVVVMVKKIRTDVNMSRTVPIFLSSGRGIGPPEDAMMID